MNQTFGAVALTNHQGGFSFRQLFAMSNFEYTTLFLAESDIRYCF